MRRKQILPDIRLFWYFWIFLIFPPMKKVWEKNIPFHPPQNHSRHSEQFHISFFPLWQVCGLCFWKDPVAFLAGYPAFFITGYPANQISGAILRQHVSKIEYNFGYSKSAEIFALVKILWIILFVGYLLFILLWANKATLFWVTKMDLRERETQLQFVRNNFPQKRKRTTVS